MINLLINKIYNLFCKKDEEEIDFDPERDYYLSNIDKLDNSDKYPISEYKAFEIASEKRNLKNDYYKRDSRCITYIGFTDCTVDMITHNNENFWHVKITRGDVSWVENDDPDDDFNQTFCDGHFIEDDFEKLQCLVNINTGEYIYFPEGIQ